MPDCAPPARSWRRRRGLLPTRRPSPASAVEELVQVAGKRVAQGLAPPREIYKAQYRKQIDWSKFPEWAQPSDPEVYEGCAHEG